MKIFDAICSLPAIVLLALWIVGNLVDDGRGDMKEKLRRFKKHLEDSEIGSIVEINGEQWYYTGRHYANGGKIYSKEKE